MIDATTRDISSNGLLFAADILPRVGTSIEFTMEMPAEVMGWDRSGSLLCFGRVVRHQVSGDDRLAAAVIDRYSLEADA